MSNEETKEIAKLVIDEAYYKNLLTMLNSSTEDQTVALQCIKPLNKQRNHMAIIFLMKDAKCSHALWHANCATIVAYLESLGIPPYGKITFNQIFKVMGKETKYKEENTKFFTVRYAEFLRGTLEKMQFVESVELNIKIKDYEQ